MLILHKHSRFILVFDEEERKLIIKRGEKGVTFPNLPHISV